MLPSSKWLRSVTHVQGTAEVVHDDVSSLLAVSRPVVFLGVPPTSGLVSGMEMGTEEEFPRMRESEAGMGTSACVPEVLPCRGQQDNNQGEAAAGCVGTVQHPPMSAHHQLGHSCRRSGLVVGLMRSRMMLAGCWQAAGRRSVAVYMISVWSERGRITAARRETDGGNPMV